MIPEALPFLAGPDISSRRKGIRLSDFMQESPQRFTDGHSRATVSAGGNYSGLSTTTMQVRQQDLFIVRLSIHHPLNGLAGIFRLVRIPLAKRFVCAGQGATQVVPTCEVNVLPLSSFIPYHRQLTPIPRSLFLLSFPSLVSFIFCRLSSSAPSLLYSHSLI